MTSFNCVNISYENTITVTKSKFIANIFYVESTQEAELCLKSVRKKYNDARHHCYACVIQNENDIYTKSSDDGEPSGTAGAPILQVLLTGDFSNTLVVVTRYFGGTLLGTGGLIRAYTDATKAVLTSSNIVHKTQGYLVELTVTYDKLEEIKYKFANKNISVLTIDYTENVKVTAEVAHDIIEQLTSEFPNIKVIKKIFQIFSK